VTKRNCSDISPRQRDILQPSVLWFRCGHDEADRTELGSNRMAFLPWVFLALGAGLIARAIVPKPARLTSWLELALIGTAGTILAAIVRDTLLGWTVMPDGWTLLLAIAGAVGMAFALRLAVRRRTRKPLRRWPEAERADQPRRAA
jgi:uncharacterized membrane protein YeaQ/YmgE (transglycosylase-associated protein family)